MDAIAACLLALSTLAQAQAHDHDAALCRRGRPGERVTIRWHQDVHLPGVTDDQVARAFRDAWAEWARFADLRVVEAGHAAGADVYAESEPIDGPGGVAAWSRFPCAGRRTRQWFDSSGRWTEPVLRGVVLHEIGHALGLDHGPQGTVMSPYWSELDRLTPDDVRRLVARYGARGPARTPGAGR